MPRRRRPTWRASSSGAKSESGYVVSSIMLGWQPGEPCWSRDERLARPLLSLDERLDEGDHDVLLFAWELRGHLEDLLELADRAGLSDRVDGGVAEDVFDADAENLGHLGE